MSRTVLLIEDNEQNRYLLSYLLSAHGWDVTTAVDGPSGLTLAQSLKPSLILLDIQLPGMDGYSVAQALRANPDLAATPVVAVTSFAMAGDRDRCLESGCSGYIEKPVDPETFTAQIEEFLRMVPGPSR